MKRVLLTTAGALACFGCEGLRGYEMLTDAIINTGVIAGTVGLATQLDSIITAIQGLFS